MNDQDERELQPARPRKSEKIWMWLAIGTILFYLLSLLVEWVHLNLAALILIVVMVFLILYFALREKPPVSFVDCLEDIANIQYKYDQHSLPTNPQDAEVIPDGPLWIAFFWHSSDSGYPLAYRYDPEKRAVIGREINDPDAILKRLQENEILRDIAKDRQRKRVQRDAEERMGYDPDDDEDKERR